MENEIIGVLACCLFGVIIMVIAASSQSENKNAFINQNECKHKWLYDGENGSNTGAFYYCEKCGKNKYLPYRELMSMPETDYIFWTTRPPSPNEKIKQEMRKNNKYYDQTSRG